MTINELQIGDWVSYVGKDFNDFADKISGIIDDCVTLDKEMIHRSIVNIHPIPLTPEIFEKNGFQKNKVSDSYYKTLLKIESKNYDYLYVRFLSGISEFDVGKSFDEQGELQEFATIKYCHELQHALRLCGLNELADNFKV